MSDDVEIIFTYKKLPKLDGFSIRIPVAGHYRPEELMDLLMFEYQWQCDEAPTETIVIRLPEF
ncbi:hypothetical protein J1C56_02000 [Aminobacter anthyllidis]|uniref:Uncharacterized protein n=1 Tax=Aminobacter anthyllidis TaxID=1035067 RepID=A0A9X1A7J1_9HYPH|nr:hypothetical protein [Aminobacter anthyllidis]MBT1154357.1 hypothetical protein [Aminobacter anthyllidis]